MTRTETVDFVGIAPGRWTALAAEPSATLVAALEDALGETGYVVDQSGGQVVLALDGPAVPDLLTKLVAIDLDPVAAPLDAAPTTVLAHVGATLLPGGTASAWRLIVGRSYLAAALRLLVASAAERGCELRV
nr:sarcosine oxidase subunit gamma family protein [Pinisolibacter aquiterrae]